MGISFPWSHRGKSSSGLAGIVANDDGLSLASIQRQGGTPRLKSCIFVPCPDAAERGRIMAETARSQGLQGAYGTLVLQNGDYSLLQIDAPEVAENELREAVRWQIRELIDFPLEEAVIDAFLVPRPKNRGPMAYAVATRQSHLKKQCDLLRAGRIKIAAVDIAELALRNLAVLLPEDSRGVALLHLSKQRGLLTVTRNGVLYLVRTLNLGTHALRAEALSEGQSTAPTAFRPLLDSVVLEIQRSLDFYESTFGQTPAGQLVIAPAAEEIPGLETYLQNYLGLKVRTLDLQEILGGPQLSAETQGQCLLAVGAALRQGGNA